MSNRTTTITPCPVCGKLMWAGPPDELQRPCWPCRQQRAGATTLTGAHPLDQRGRAEAVNDAEDAEDAQHRETGDFDERQSG